MRKTNKEEITEIEVIECNEEFHDIHTETENYIANSIVVHNCTPSRKSAALGIYLPNTLKQSVHIVVSVDTSGSISQEELKEFLSEMVAITESFPNINMDVIVCDCVVHETYKIDSTNVDSICGLTFSGSGGTDHKVILKHIKNEINDIKVLIAFTDGYTSFGEQPQGYDVLWVLTKNSINPNEIPYGEVIKIDE